MTEKQICSTCGLAYDNQKFYPKVGKALDASTAFNLVCQFAKNKTCLNPCKEINKNSDSWEKRTGIGIVPIP